MDILKEFNILLLENEIKNLKESDCDDYDLNIKLYHYEAVLKNAKKYPENYLMVIQNDEFFDIVIKEFIEDILVLEPCFDTEDSAEELHLLFSEYPNALIRLSSYYHFDIKEEGFFECSLKSSLDEKKEYITEYNSTFLTNKEENIYLLRDIYEKTYLCSINMSEIHYELLSSKDIENKFSERTFFSHQWKEPCRSYVNAGFHYFNHCETFGYDTPHILYLVAMDSRNNIIGVIKYGTYERGKLHLGLNYIDVRMDLRGKGLATNLIREFAKVIPKNLPLILSDESEMGAKCNMGKHFKEEITKVAPAMKVVFTKELYSYEEL